MSLAVQIQGNQHLSTELFKVKQVSVKLLRLHISQERHLDLVEIPLDDGKAIYDTPGIINDHQIAHHLDAKDLKAITPKKELKPKVFQLMRNRHCSSEDLPVLTLFREKRSSFMIYVSNDLQIHRTKLANADALYEKHVGAMLITTVGEIN